MAGLLFAYYPDLSAAEVKQIIMDSGVRYDYMVKVPTKEDKERKVPFPSLSKSGKVINAYNAFIMAESVVNAR